MTHINGLTELMRLHPASRFGGSKDRRPDYDVFEDPESWHPHPGHRHEADRRKPARTIRRVAAAAAMLVGFAGVLMLIALT